MNVSLATRSNLGSSLTTSPVGAQASSAPQAADEELVAVAQALSGAYDNFTQNTKDEATLASMKAAGQETINFYVHAPVQMHIVPVGEVVPQERPSQTFYVEQFQSDAQDAPYRQRLYVLTRGESGALIDRIYKLDNADALIGAYAHPERLSALDAQKAHLQDGCDMTFTATGPQHWHGEAGQDGTCRSTYFGALLHSRVELDPDRLVSLDQGRSRSGGLIFGPNDDAGGYEFEKRSCYAFSSPSPTA